MKGRSRRHRSDKRSDDGSPYHSRSSDRGGSSRRISDRGASDRDSSGRGTSDRDTSDRGAFASFVATIAEFFAAKFGGKRSSISEEEIKNLVKEHDDLLDEEKRMIGEIFDMGDTVAREIMVPRVDMVVVEDTMTVIQVIRRMRETGFSRLPVFQGDRDKIIGIAMVKDLLEPLMSDRENDLVSAYIRTPVFVPETKDILPLLSEMQSEHNQMVVVVDEYGGIAGLLSVEDIVEEIVGEIADEYDPDRKFVTRISDTEWVVDGRLAVADAVLEGIPVEESDEYDTVAGWLMDAIDGIPSVGDSFELGHLEVVVQSMRHKRISLLRIRRIISSLIGKSALNGELEIIDVRFRDTACDFKLSVSKRLEKAPEALIDHAIAARPTLTQHACTDEDEELKDMSVPHLIEHLAIDYLVEFSRNNGTAYSGYTVWLDRKRGICRVTLKSLNHAQTEQAMSAAFDLVAAYLTA